MAWRKKMAFLLSLLLVCSMADISAFAEDTEWVDTPPVAEKPLEEEKNEKETESEEDKDEESAEDAEISAVQEKIHALPDMDALSAADYDAVQAAYDAYDALDAAQQAQITGAERFEALFVWFAAQTAPSANEAKGDVATVTISDENGNTTTKSYAALPDALSAAAESGGTVQLLREVVYEDLMGKEDTYTFPSGTYTLDLNGNTINANKISVKWTIPADATLTIKSSAESKGVIYATITNEGNLTLENVQYSPSWAEKLVFSKGTVKAKNTVFDGGNMDIMGGTFSATKSDFEKTVYIHGGEVDLKTCNASSVIHLFSGKLTLDGNSVIRTVYARRNSEFFAFDGTWHSDGTLIIKSGTLNGLFIDLADIGKIEIQGGKVDEIAMDGGCENGTINIRNATIQNINNLGSPKLNIYSGTITEKMFVRNKGAKNIQLYGGIFAGGIQMEDSKGKIGTLLAEGVDFRKADSTWATPEERNSQALLQALTVEKTPLASVSLTPAETELIYGESTTLTMNAVKADGVTENITYKWYLDDVEDTAQTGATFLFPTGKPKSYAVKCEVACDKYTIVKNATVKVNRKPINHSDITVSMPTEFTFSPTYRGNGAGSPYTLTKRGDAKNVSLKDKGVEMTSGYSLSGDQSGTNAGTYTLVINGFDNYTGTREVEWKILPYEILGNHKNPIKLKQKEYDGTNQGTVETFSFFNNSSKVVTLHQNAGYFSSDVTYDSAEVGENYNVTAKVTLESDNYVFADGAKSKTFSLTGQSIIKNKTNIPLRETVTVQNQRAHIYEVDVTSLLKVPAGTAGAITNVTLTPIMTQADYLDSAKIEDGKLKLAILAKDTDVEGKIGEITAQIETEHYQDITLTFSLNALNKMPMQGAPTLSKTTLTYGDSLSDIILSGTMTDVISGASVTGSFAWQEPSEQPNAGTQNVNGVFTPDDTDTYGVQTGTAQISVSQANSSGTPTYTKITEAGKTLADAKLGIGTISPAGTIVWDAGDAEPIVQERAYGWTFTPDDAANYAPLSGTIVPWEKSPAPITPPPNNGNTNNGNTNNGNTNNGNTNNGNTNNGNTNNGNTNNGNTNNGNTNNGNTNNGNTNNGNTDNGNTNNGNTNNGNTGSNTSSGNHTKPSKQPAAEPNPSVTPAKPAATIIINTKGNLAETTTIRDAEMADAVQNGTPIRVPFAVAAGKDSTDMPLLSADFRTDAAVELEIPVTNCNSGTVAVLVQEDGTEEIVKTTIQTENGVRITVSGNMQIKIMDNSKDFSDTKGHWAKDAVNFVAARGIFSGVSKDTFGVNEPMTRGMLDTALARLAGVDTSGGKTWYEKGVAWAMANGISDGTHPEAPITREQLVTILYRFAGTPAAEGELDFADAQDVSGYARQAMLWALQNGILSGMKDGTIAPRAEASRAQVAAIFMRWMEL